MSTVEDQAMLANVNAAINSIVSGKVAEKASSSTDGVGKSLTMLPITQLWQIKKELESRLASAAGTGFLKASFTDRE